MKATDLWTLFCYLGVFYSLTEYCIILYLTKYADWEIELRELKKDNKMFKKAQPVIQRSIDQENREKLITIAGRIEYVSRVFVPMYFILFTSVYWIICLA